MSKDLWGRLAGSYNVDHTYIAGADLVSAIQSELVAAVPVGTVVELGCGTGLYTKAYARKCREVIGIDLSEEMVGAARRSLADLQNVSVVVGDATRTGLTSATADGVVAVNLLHIVPDPAAVLAEARRILRPGGVLIVVDATAEGLSIVTMLVSIWRVLRRWGPMTRLKGQTNLTQASLTALVRTAGFNSVEGTRSRERR